MVWCLPDTHVRISTRLQVPHVPGTHLQRHFLESGLERFWTEGNAGFASPAFGRAFSTPSCSLSDALALHRIHVIVLMSILAVACAQWVVQTVGDSSTILPDLHTWLLHAPNILDGYHWGCAYTGGNRNCLLLSSSDSDNNQSPLCLYLCNDCFQPSGDVQSKQRWV